MDEATERGEALGKRHRRELEMVNATRKEIDEWVRQRIADGWSINRAATVLGVSPAGLKRKLERHGVAYEPKPGGWHKWQREGGAA